ncbi:MAG: hypothetical protein AAFQ05_06105, partial [Pseudomonadota bacterium]
EKRGFDGTSTGFETGRVAGLSIAISATLPDMRPSLGRGVPQVALRLSVQVGKGFVMVTGVKKSVQAVSGPHKFPIGDIICDRKFMLAEPGRDCLASGG